MTLLNKNPDKQFKIAYRNTIETSLNGYTGLEMIEMFNDAAQIGIGYIPSNVIFSKEWVNINKLNTQPQITPEQKREAQQKFQEYVNATGKQGIEGFKEFVGNEDNNESTSTKDSKGKSGLEKVKEKS